MLAATALFGSFQDAVKAASAEAIDTTQAAGSALFTFLQGSGQYLGCSMSNPRNLVGLIIGAAVVFMFSGLAINAVTRPPARSSSRCAASSRRSRASWRAPTAPEYGRVVDICTRDSLRELATPGLLAILTPIAVGFGLGVGALGSYLAAPSPPAC